MIKYAAAAAIAAVLASKYTSQPPPYDDGAASLIKVDARLLAGNAHGAPFPPRLAGEMLAHAQVAERYGVRFACVCGGCKRTRVDASDQLQYACDMHARTGAVFMVEAIGVAPVTDMLLGESAVRWAMESPRCRAVAAAVG